MTDDKKFELSRRKVLGGLGTIGLASAGAGLGTTAYFSDQERYTENTLTAGELDLKVDWEEHYSDWSDDEAEAAGDIVMIDQRTDADGDGDVDNDDLVAQVPDGYTGLPDAEAPLIAVPDENLGAFMDATSIEAYPDANNDGIQDDFRMDEEFDECEQLADTPEDMDPTDGLRTENDDTVTEEGEVAPLVNLQDIKPGDFGELTLSFHVCDNPGYVWMNGELVNARENQLTEPESKDPDEVDGSVELLDAVQTLLWYDEDGDNVYEPGGVAGAVDLALVGDISGSMGEGSGAQSKLEEAQDAGVALIESLGSDDNAAGISFTTTASTDFRLKQMTSSNKSSLQSATETTSPQNRTNIQDGVIHATEELLGQESGYVDAGPYSNPQAGAFNNHDTGTFGNPAGGRNSEQVMVVLSDGVANEYFEEDGSGPTSGGPSSSPSTDPADTDATRAAVNAAAIAKANGIRVFTIGFDLDALDDDGTQTLAENTLQEMASPDDFFTDVQQGELINVISQIAQTVEGEECFWRGSLRQTLNVLNGKSADGSTVINDGLGIPLDGNRDTEYEEIVDPQGEAPKPNAGANENRECFVNSTTNDIGMAWWLPVDHGNEIQSDSVEFDLGFYTEQCRHNNGAGMAPSTDDPNNPEPS